jgi:hypothetical protein
MRRTRSCQRGSGRRLSKFHDGSPCQHVRVAPGQVDWEEPRLTSYLLQYLRTGFHNIREVRQHRIRYLRDVVDEYLIGYKLRYRSATFATYALGHVSRILGAELIVDIDEAAVLKYQEDRLREKAAPKSINEEVRFLLKMLGDSGEVIRAHLRKKKQLKLAVRKRIGKAFDAEETQSLTEKAKLSRSPHMFPAFMLARDAGLRDTEIKTLTWGQVNLKAKDSAGW